MDETKYWLWLSMIFGSSSRRIWEAMKLFGSVREAYDVISSGEINLRLSEREKKNLGSFTASSAEYYIDECLKRGVKTVGCGDRAYPAQLRHIFNPPAVLFYQGDLSCVCGGMTVTAVGARRASDYSLHVCSEICSELAQKGVVIVSGFALGTDITAHLAAADALRPTAAVLGCGLDADYPRENMIYKRKILDSGGVFISEYPLGTTPMSGNFPIRNRILAALGRAALVFEASAKSGSLITANIAANQGRNVYVMPPADIFAQRFGGNIALLRDGAELLLDARGVLEGIDRKKIVTRELREEIKRGVSFFGVSELAPPKVRRRNANVKDDESSKKAGSAKKNKGKPVPQPMKSASEELDLTDIQKEIIAAMDGSAVHVDALAEQLGTELSELFTELTELEIIGAVRSLPGRMYEPAI